MTRHAMSGVMTHAGGHSRRMPGDRKPKQVKLTPEAIAGWARLQREYGRTLTALVEAIGLDLAAGRNPLPQRIIQEATRIDLERFSR